MFSNCGFTLSNTVLKLFLIFPYFSFSSPCFSPPSPRPLSSHSSEKTLKLRAVSWALVILLPFFWGSVILAKSVSFIPSIFQMGIIILILKQSGKVRYIQFSSFAIVTTNSKLANTKKFYNFTTNTELANTEPLLLEEIQG